jgi:hypothetical protein
VNVATKVIEEAIQARKNEHLTSKELRYVLSQSTSKDNPNVNVANRVIQSVREATANKHWISEELASLLSSLNAA